MAGVLEFAIWNRKVTINGESFPGVSPYRSIRRVVESPSAET